MAVVPYRPTPTTEPTAIPTPYQSLRTPTATPAEFGGATAEGARSLGQDLQVAGQHWGQIAADDMANEYEATSGKLLYGDPNSQGPDGKPLNGYFDLKGRAALDARPGLENKLDDLLKQTRSKLTGADQQRQFDNITRRFRNMQSERVGAHSVAEARVYGLGVNGDTIKLKASDIAVAPLDEERFLHNQGDMIHAAAKIAELNGAEPGDAQWNQAVNTAKAAAAEARIMAIGATDPGAAISMADRYRADLGTHYATTVDHFRARRDQQSGRDIANGVAAGSGAPNENNIGNVRPRGSNTGFQQVGSFDEGVNLAVQNARSYPQAFNGGKDMTLQQIGSKWAPKGDGANDPNQWARNVAGGSGLPVDKPINLNDPDTAAKFARGVHVAEWGAGKARPLDDYKTAIGGGKTPASTPPPYDQQIKDVLNMHLEPTAQAAALAQLAHIHTAQTNAQTQQKAEFKQRVDDSTAEAMQTGTTTKPMIESDFTNRYGPVDGPAAYADYQSDISFGADWKAMQSMSDVQQHQFLDTRMPSPGAPGYARSIKNQERLQKAVAIVQKMRAEDPAGSVDHNGAVQSAFQGYDPRNPETFKPVITARIAAQDQLGIPKEAQTAISETEAKQYAATLKPVSKEGVPPQNQEQVINAVVDGVRAKYGDHAEEAMSRILYHVTLKKDASEVLATALVRNSKGEEFGPTAEEARKVQIERDAQRAAQIATQVTGTVSSGAVGGGAAGAISDSRELPPPASPLSPQGVGQVVNQANQKTQKPFNEAVDILRSDPAKYMPYFIKKFGPAKVPPDLQQYVPKAKVSGDGG